MAGQPLLFILAALLSELPALAQEGRIEEIQVYSKGLEGNLLEDSATRNVTVYLPHEYGAKPDKRYPVLYLLHGYYGTNNLWFDGQLIKDLHLAMIADRLIADGLIQPLIVVAPDGCNRYHGSWYSNSPVTGNWEDFITKDLIAHIDAHYRTIAKRTSRGIAGHSMGGHGAIKIAMKHPELYCSLYGMSPAAIDFQEIVKPPFTKHFIEAAQTKDIPAFAKIHWRSQSLIALAAAVASDPEHGPFYGDLPLDANGNRVESIWQTWLKQDLSTGMLATYGDNLCKYRAIAIDCGTEEDLLPSIQAFVANLEKAGIKHAFEKFQGDHVNCVASQLENRVLPLFSATLEADQQTAIVPIR